MKYRILTKEEKKHLTFGMHLAIGTSWGIHDGIYPDLLSKDTHVNLWGGDTIEEKTDFADLYIMEDELKDQQPENFKLDEKNEIKKELYRQNPKAELINVTKDRLFYIAKIQLEDEDKTLRFFIPLGDIGDAKFEWLMEAKLLIRWLEQ